MKSSLLFPVQHFGVLAALATSALFSPAVAQSPADTTTLKIAALKAPAVLIMQHGVEAGYFTKEGLKLEATLLNNGPAVVSAVVSRSADIGFGAAIAIISARAAGQPVKFFMEAAIEKADSFSIWIDAAGRHGNLSLQMLKGKTIALNAVGGGCEMQLRAHLKAAAMSWEDVKTLIVPLPQIPATLQLGNADAACTIEPFHSSARANPQIAARTVASGMFPNLPASSVGLIDGYFGRDDWLTNNASTMVRFSRAYLSAARDVMKDSSVLARQMQSTLNIAAPIAETAAKTSFDTRNGPVPPEDVAIVVEMMVGTGMLAKPMSAVDIIFPVDR